MKTILALLATALVSFAETYNLTLEWNRNPESEVIGYRVHYGTESGKYDTVVEFLMPFEADPAMLQGTFPIETGKLYYFALTAFDATMVDSPFSEELASRIGGISAPTGAPKIVKLELQSSADGLNWETFATIDKVYAPEEKMFFRIKDPERKDPPAPAPEKAPTPIPNE